jgi:hypothetical protein
MFIPLPPHHGSFGAVRTHDIHTGVDLYLPNASPIVAIEDGIVVGIIHFTGVLVDTPWWNDTQAILIEGQSGVIVYGEVEPSPIIHVNSIVQKGKTIGHVKRVLKKDKGLPTAMLHLELYDSMTRNVVECWKLGTPQPYGLNDPTEIIKAHVCLNKKGHMSLNITRCDYP